MIFSFGNGRSIPSLSFTGINAIFARLSKMKAYGTLSTQKSLLS
jgi:hypothetical protein